MVAICNSNIEEKKQNLYAYLYAYESVLRAALPPSAKIIAQILIYQGALNKCGCCISNGVIGGFTLLDRATVIRQLNTLVKAKLFIRNREKNDPYTYYFNRNTEEWEVERYE